MEKHIIYNVVNKFIYFFIVCTLKTDCIRCGESDETNEEYLLTNLAYLITNESLKL